MQELISYFMSLGMSPQAAAMQANEWMRPEDPAMKAKEDASFTGAQQRVQELFAKPHDALEDLLTKKYDMPPDLAKSYAHDVLNGDASHANDLRTEAAQNVVGQTVKNLATTGRYAAAMHRAQSGVLNPEDMGYVQEVHDQQKRNMLEEAKSLREEKLQALARHEENAKKLRADVQARYGLRALAGQEAERLGNMRMFSQMEPRGPADPPNPMVLNNGLNPSFIDPDSPRFNVGPATIIPRR